MGETYKISIVVDGQDNASAPLGKVGAALGGLGNIAGGILSAAIIQNIFSGISNLGKAALTAYADYERLGMSLQSLAAREMVNAGMASSLGEAMGAAGLEAQKLQGWIQELAIKSPFQQKDIADSFRMAMAYGFTTNEAQRLTSAMVDYTSATGASGDVMGRIALALGQIKSKGKLAGQEILQLTEAGIPVRQILADSFGVTTAELEKMISKGLVPADQAIEAITKSIEEDFGGAAERQAETFSGLLSSLKDIKEVGLREFFTGTFQAIQPYVADFVGMLSSPETMAKIKDFGLQLGTSITGFITTMDKATGPIRSYFGNLFGAIGDAGVMQDGKFTSEFLEALTAGLPDGLQETIAGIFSTFEKFGQFFTEQGPGISEVITEIFGNLGETLGPLLTEYLTTLRGLLDQMGTWLNDNGPLIQAFLTNLGIAINFAVEAFLNYWPIIQNSLTWAMDTILSLGTLIMQIFTGDFPGAAETVKGIFEDLVTNIWENMQLFATWVLDTFFGMTFEEGKAVVDGAILDIINWFTNLKNKGIEVLDAIKTSFDNIAKAIQSAIDKIKAFLSAIADAVIPDWAANLLGIGGSKPKGKAKGGIVYPGTTYLVGEEGPEFFTPSTTGTIIPNNKLPDMGANLSTYNSKTINITVNNNGRDLDENTLAGAISSWEMAYGF